MHNEMSELSIPVERFKICLIIIALLSPIPASAQFVPGYVIDLEKDTLHGMIRNDGAVKNARLCIFKSPEGVIKEFSPEEISAFRFIDGKNFIAEEVLLDGREDKVFLEWIIYGKMSVLSYAHSASNVKYYVRFEDEEILHELVNTREDKVELGYTVEKENREYIDSLQTYLSEYPELQQKIKNLSYHEKDFVNIAKAYHELSCDEYTCVVFERKKNLSVTLGATFGFMWSGLRFNNDIPEEAYAPVSPGGGVSVEMADFPFLSSRFALRSSVIYHQLSYSYAYEGSYLDGQYIGENEQLFEMQILRIPVQMKFDLTQGRLRPYMAAGITANIRLQYEEVNEELVDYITRHYDYTLGIKPLQLGFHGSGGLTLTLTEKLAFDFSLTYEYGYRFMGTYIEDKSSTNNLIIGSGIYLKIK